MPVTVGNFVTESRPGEYREPFKLAIEVSQANTSPSTAPAKQTKSIFQCVQDDTFPDVVPTATLAMADAQLKLNGIDVAAINPDIATLLERATVRSIMQRILQFSLCEVCHEQFRIVINIHMSM